jgi:hypothetical protein
MMQQEQKHKEFLEKLKNLEIRTDEKNQKIPQINAPKPKHQLIVIQDDQQNENQVYQGIS